MQAKDWGEMEFKILNNTLSSKEWAGTTFVHKFHLIFLSSLVILIQGISNLMNQKTMVLADM